MFIVLMFTSSTMSFLLLTTSSSLIALQISDKIIKCRHVFLKLLCLFSSNEWKIGSKRFASPKSCQKVQRWKYVEHVRAWGAFQPKKGLTRTIKIVGECSSICSKFYMKNCTRTQTTAIIIVKIHNEHNNALGLSCTIKYYFFIQCYL